jgi:hypothetical protein
MSRNTHWNSLGILAGCLVALWMSVYPDVVYGQWRRAGTRRWARGGEGVKEIAPKSDPAARSYRPLDVYYSYDLARRDDYAFPDRIRVFLLVRDPEVLQCAGGLVAEVQVTDLSNSRRSRLEYVDVTLKETTAGEFRLATFEVTNTAIAPDLIQPAHVYRLFVNLHRAAPHIGSPARHYGPDSALGKVPFPYYVATGGDSRLDRARRHIAMRTFREFYYAQQGWPTDENYPMDCYAYYTWAVGSCTVGSQNGRAMLERLFGTLFPFTTGRELKRFALQGPIHGDYVRKPGHSFMLLAYDQSTGFVWTMEGNFNATIEIAVRSVDPNWTLGHLVEEHVKPGMFELTESGKPFPAAQPTL